MAKKKNVNPIGVAYAPINTVQDIAPIVEQKIDQIPPYEDSGVAWRGKYKIQKTLTNYELKGQQYRYYYEPTGAGTTGFIIRANYQTTVFYCTRIILTWYWAANQNDEPFNLYNGYYLIGGIDPQFQMTVSRAERGRTLVIDLPVPIKFSAQLIGYDAGNSAGASDYMNFTLIGWEEQI